MSGRGILLGGLLTACGLPGADANGFFRIEPLRGYADLGIVAGDAPTNALEAGTGKLRYGDDGKDLTFEPVFSEARLIGAVGIGAAWRVVVDVKYDDDQRHLLDIGEAFVSWRSAPGSGGLRFRAKAGSFLPPFSLENRAIGWTSPLTLSSSALNAWIGEELRINGAELRVVADRNDWRYSVAASGYLANDAAGTILAYRGFAIHDRELGLFDRERMPRFQAALINPFGPFRAQSHYFEPLHEIDGRPGFYGGATASHADGRRLEVYYYDNNGDPEAFNRTAGQYAWRTRFGVAGLRWPLPWQLQFTSQVMLGDTATGERPGGVGPHILETDFFTGYGLITRTFGDTQTTLRGEYFEMRDKDVMRRVYDNAESGHGWTLAASHPVYRKTKLFLEAQYIEHERPVRVFAGEPRRLDEWLVRLSLRIFL